MENRSCQARKHSRAIAFLDRRGLWYRQRRVSTRSHAQAVKLLEAIPHTGD